MFKAQAANSIKYKAIETIKSAHTKHSQWHTLACKKETGTMSYSDYERWKPTGQAHLTFKLFIHISIHRNILKRNFLIKIYKANVQLPYLSACLCITHVDWNHPVSDGNMMSIVGPTNDMQIKIFLRKKKLCSFILNTYRPLWAHNHALERTKPSLKRVKITQFILYQNFYIIVYLSLNWFQLQRYFPQIQIRRALQ